MTGTEIAEIATVVTDPALEVVAEGPCLSLPEVSLEEAATQTLRFLVGQCAEGSAPVCGNEVYRDRVLLARHMPAVVAHLHYRMIDIASVRELVSRWFPSELQAPVRSVPEGKGHTLEAIRASIEELRWYRDRLVAPSAPPQEPAV